MKSLLVVAAVSASVAAAPWIGAQPLAAAVETPKQLATGNLWIRAVAAPNYHKYLQTKPANEPGTAVLESYTTAGQFNVVDGQLVNKVSTPPLYLWVEEPADKATPPRTLKTWFNTTKNPFGTFAFQGDSLSWSAPNLKRQNLGAWLVCAKQALFINTGAYSYQTPSGCADQTVSLALWSRIAWTCRRSCVADPGAVRYTSTTTRRRTTERHACTVPLYRVLD